MSNEDIKRFAREHQVRMYEIASEFEMNESVLSRMFRCELDEEMKQVIISTIRKIAEEKKEKGCSSKKQKVTSLMRERVLAKANTQKKKTKTSSTKKSMETTSSNVKVSDKKKSVSAQALDNDFFDELMRNTDDGK